MPSKPNDVRCIESPSLNLGKCESDTGFCYTYTTEKYFFRGCIGDSIIANKTICNNPANCTSCWSNQCNSKPITLEKCYSDIYDKHHPFDVSKTNSIECPVSFESQGCYDMIDDMPKRKDCVSALSKDEKIKCKQNDMCEICHGNKCNRGTGSKRKCFSCYSKTDSDCIEPIISGPKWTRFRTCKYSTSSCIVAIDAEGHTQRGCVKNHSMIAVEYPGGADVCNTDFCNSRLYPMERLKCFHCNGSQECDQLSREHPELWTLKTEYCQRHLQDDSCISFIHRRGMFELVLFFFFADQQSLIDFCYR